MHPFLQENLTIVNILLGAFVFLNINLGVTTPHITQTHSIFSNLHLCKTLVFVRSIASGITNIS